VNQQTLATAPPRAAARQLLDLIGGSWATQAIGVAARLGLADQVAAGVRDPDALARACGCDASALHRLMRGLAALGLLRLDGDGRCTLTPTGELLRRDAPLSLNAHAQWWSQQAWAVWSDLMGSVRTGQSARQRAHGQTGFDHLEGDAAASHLFHRSMVEQTRLVATDLAASPALPETGVVMDLGGGHGELLAEVLRTRPHLRGVLFDLGHAVDGAQHHLRAAGVADRVTVTAGDFFAPLPGPVDAVLLKSVLHDWPDDEAVRILRRAREALTPGGRVLVIERVMPVEVQDRPEHRTTTRSDLNMLVGLGGCERTEDDYAALLQAAGLGLRQVHAAAAAFSVVEAGVPPGKTEQNLPGDTGVLLPLL
jgi:SAM-dependent methyltransferase